MKTPGEFIYDFYTRANTLGKAISAGEQIPSASTLTHLCEILFAASQIADEGRFTVGKFTVRSTSAFYKQDSAGVFQFSPIDCTLGERI
jgi:hypothetical protein